MKYLKTLTSPLFIMLFALPVLTTGCNSGDNAQVPAVTNADTDRSTPVDDVSTDITDILDTLPLEAISAEESDGLVYMREEEKLARDVYIAMYALGYSKVFDNISNSEQTHTDAILQLLEKYGITDPVGNNAEGVFTNPKLQSLYDDLIVLGSPSLIDALYVGAAIEEIDIIDIQVQLDTVVDNQDITTVYENLIKGSQNHLRAFVKNLANQGVDYQPLYLSQQVYDEIINAE